MDGNDLDNRFRYHAPDTEDRIDAHKEVRALCGSVAKTLNNIVPDGREKSLAITHLEQVMMWANAGIARQP